MAVGDHGRKKPVPATLKLQTLIQQKFVNKMQLRQQVASEQVICHSHTTPAYLQHHTVTTSQSEGKEPENIAWKKSYEQRNSVPLRKSWWPNVLRC